MSKCCRSVVLSVRHGTVYLSAYDAQVFHWVTIAVILHIGLCSVVCYCLVVTLYSIQSVDILSYLHALFLPLCRVLLCTVRSFSVVLHKKFFDEKYFSKNLWQLFFSLCTTFITQPSLKVEELSDYKRYKSLTRYVSTNNTQTHTLSVYIKMILESPSCMPIYW